MRNSSKILPINIGVGLLLLFLAGCAGPGLYMEGQKLEEAAKWEEAYEQYKVQLEQHPRDSKTKKALEYAGKKASEFRYNNAKSIFESTHELNPAIAHLEKALVFDSKNNNATNLLNQLNGEKNKAMELFKTALNFQKEEVYLKAVKLLREALQIYPDSLEIQKGLKEIENNAVNSYSKRAGSLSAEQKWKEALELYKELDSFFPKDEKIVNSVKDLETKNLAQEKITEAESLLNDKRLDTSLKLVEEALKIFPEYDKAQLLLQKVKMAIAQEYVEKAGFYAREKNWIEALNQYGKAEEFIPDYEGLKELKEEAKNNLVEFYYNHGIGLYQDKKYKEAYFEFLKIFEYKKKYKNTEQKLEEIRTSWASDFYNEIINLKSKENYGNALLKCIAVEMLQPEFAKQNNVQNTILELQKRITDRVTFRIAIFGIENYSTNPELGGRLVDGIFEFLLQKSIGTLQIVDRTSEDDVRYEAKLTGAELAELKPISAFIDGSVYPLKIDTKQEVSREAKKLKVGSVKAPNPRRAEIIARLNAIGSTIPGYQQRSSALTGKAVSDYAQLYTLSKAAPMGYPGDSADALSALFGMFSAMGASDTLASAQNECAKLEQELASIPEFIEEPKYASVETGGDNYIKTARLKSYVKIRDFATRQPIFTQEIEEIEVASDRFVKGDEEAGIAKDPLDLPTDTELAEKVTNNLVKKAGNILYDNLKDYGLAYYRLANQEILDKNEANAIERCYDFLASYTAQLYPERASIVLACLESKLAEFVPEQARKQDIKAAALFPEVEQKIHAIEEQNRVARLYRDRIGLARQFIEKQDWQAAINKAYNALTAKPDDEEARKIIEKAFSEQKKQSLLEAARSHMSEGNFEAAISTAKSVLNIDPDNKEAKKLKFAAELRYLPRGFNWQNETVICEKDESEMILVMKEIANYIERYLIDKYEVTNKQFSKFIAETGYQAKGRWKQNFKKEQDNYPVRGISYEDARAYAQWAFKDLPTQEQWIYAAMGKDKLKYPWGNEFNIEKEKIELLREARAVGTNPLDISQEGCYDMAGNVSEWVKGYAYGLTQTLLGGNYEIKPAEQSYSFKLEVTPDRALPEYGFRCVKELEFVSTHGFKVKQLDSKNLHELKLQGMIYGGETDKKTAVINNKAVKAGKIQEAENLIGVGEKTELRGRIVAIDRQNNLAVINLGKQDGIDIGNRLNVYRGETFLGSVEIIQARDRISAAYIIDKQEGRGIEINDTVVKR